MVCVRSDKLATFTIKLLFELCQLAAAAHAAMHATAVGCLRRSRSGSINLCEQILAMGAKYVGLDLATFILWQREVEVSLQARC